MVAGRRRSVNRCRRRLPACPLPSPKTPRSDRGSTSLERPPPTESGRRRAGRTRPHRPAPGRTTDRSARRSRPQATPETPGRTRIPGR
jgi:hypothetical protein